MTSTAVARWEELGGDPAEVALAVEREEPALEREPMAGGEPAAA